MESAKIYPLNRNRFERSLKVSAPPTPPKPKLLDQVRQAIRTRHYSYMTGEGLPQMDQEIHLLSQQTPSGGDGSRDCTVSFRFSQGLSCQRFDPEPGVKCPPFSLSPGKEVGDIAGVVRAKRPSRLSVVLTRQEVKPVFIALRHRLDHGYTSLRSGSSFDGMHAAQSQRHRHL
jgi:hypothetical protein